MTQQTYRTIHNIEISQGKHCKQRYKIWGMYSPEGPFTEFEVVGLEEARHCAMSFWNSEITRLSDGRIIQ